MATTLQARHVDKGVLLAHFAAECLTVCPNCSGPVVVISESKFAVPFRPLRPRASCLKCSFQKIDNSGVWFGPVTGNAKERCSKCGFKWLTARTHRKTLPKRMCHIRVHCPSCENDIAVKIKWSVSRVGGIHDPSFGLPLWLQTSCRGEILWAYNGEHLTALRSYVSAGLRESTGLHRSMFSRLPKWLCLRGNREVVLACIDRLDQMLPSQKSNRSV
jgi:hypothetical protein